MNCSLLGSSGCGISQEWLLEWVAISLSKESSWPRDQTCVFCIAGRFFHCWATRETQRHNDVFLSYMQMSNIGIPEMRQCWDNLMLKQTAFNITNTLLVTYTSTLCTVSYWKKCFDFWLCWSLSLLRLFSSCRVRGLLSSGGTDFSLWWFLLLQSMTSRASEFQ